MLERARLTRLGEGLRPAGKGEAMRLGIALAALRAGSESEPEWGLHAATVLQLAGLAAIAAGLLRAYVERATRANAAISQEALAAAAQLAFRLNETATLEALLRHALGVAIRVRLDAPPGQPRGVVRWVVDRRGSWFHFHPDFPAHEFLNTVTKHWAWSLGMLATFTRTHTRVRGSTMFNLEDMGSVPGLAFCENRPGYFLIPDPIFMGSDGYRDVRAMIDAARPDWHSRRPLAFWRGTTTGWLGCDGQEARSWRRLPRAVLCELAGSAPSGWYDVGFSGVTQLDAVAAAEVQASGLMAAPVPIPDFAHYRYQIDIDGNTNAWMALWVKLYGGSPVLKVASAAGFRQWYYDRLQPWRNFVPVAADMTDLHEKLQWLRAHDDKAEAIGQRGYALAAAMTPDAEARRAAPALDAALRAGG